MGDKVNCLLSEYVLNYLVATRKVQPRPIEEESGQRQFTHQFVRVRGQHTD